MTEGAIRETILVMEIPQIPQFVSISIQVDDPPYLSVGTEVSAKYKGAFCEAKVRKVVRNIKCKIAYKQGLGSGTVSDDQIKGELLRVGATVEVKHPDRREFVEATITKIQDCSQYTVVFDDGDITTLRRSALCLKSGRHFNESETLDQLPLTHPEHFGNPVIGGRRGRRSRHMPDDSSEDDDEPTTTKQRIIEKEEHIGKVVCVENSEAKKKSSKENWFPALVVAPTAQDTVRIRVKEEYLVRSFKDGRYYTVPKKEATEFTREKPIKQDSDAMQAALEYLDNDSLPPHWDRDSLFGTGNCSSDFDAEYDSDSSDDEPREEKDHFVAQLYKYMDDRGTPLNKGPSIVNKDVDLYRLFRAVQKLGGYNRVTSQSQWKQIATRLGYTPTTTSIQNLVKQAYKKFLLPFEEFDRKLGCTMVAHPRANRIKGRSLVRANSVASPKPDQKESKTTTVTLISVTTEESENTSESSTDNLKAKRKMSTGSGTGKVKALVDKFEDKVKEDTIAKRTTTIDSDTKDIVKEQKETRETKKIREPKEGKDTKESKAGKDKDTADTTTSTRTTTSNKNITVKDEQQPQSPVTLAVTATAPITTTQLIPVKKEKNSKKSQNTPQDEKKGKKRKEIDSDKAMDKEKAEANDFPIEVGDKLKVYYHEQKVTYEAKVIEISVQQGNPLYLVHYTGWNTRYDEWVPKERIAENLTNNKTNKRAKTASKVDNKVNSIMALESKIAQSTSGSSSNNNGAGSSGSNSGHQSTGPTTKPTAIKRVRGTSRGESQPPRSTTPSSIASNSSRTKSPATPATTGTSGTQRRATRGQPASVRRTSNNTDISSSVQTDTDTDSDEPVKKAPSRKTQLSRGSNSTTSGSTTSSVIQPVPLLAGNTSTRDTKTNSTGSSEEESSSTPIVPPTSTSGTTKGRDYDLNQIRSELKGFKELKSPSPDTVDTETEVSEKKFDFPSSSASGAAITNSESCDSASQDLMKPLTSDNNSSKTSTDTSSESGDSFGDDDSQFSDKTTTLENISEKLQEKFKAGKLDTDVFKKTTTSMAALPLSSPTPSTSSLSLSSLASPASTSHELVQKVATLKASGIEKIIKNSLADKSKRLPEKMTSMKPICIETSSLLKPLEWEKEKIKNDPSSVIFEVATIENSSKAQSSQKVTAKAIEPIALEKLHQSSILKPPFISCIKPATGEKQSIKEKLALQDAIKDEPTKSSLIGVETKITPSPCDVYEFKEPEPFEYETPKKLSPDNLDKKIKKKFNPNSVIIDLKPNVSSTSTLSVTPKKLKKSVIKEEIKLTKMPKVEDVIHTPPPPVVSTAPVSIATVAPATVAVVAAQLPPPPLPVQSPQVSVVSTASSLITLPPPLPQSSATATTPPAIISTSSLIPSKSESIFDSLRKSPSFNLNLATQHVQEEMIGLSLCREEIKQEPVTVAASSKPTFISSFVEAGLKSKSSEETLKIFDVKGGSCDGNVDKIAIAEKFQEFETAKKVLSTDIEKLLDIEPPKIEKPSSIADKVLKALNQQQNQKQQSSNSTSSEAPLQLSKEDNQQSKIDDIVIDKPIPPVIVDVKPIPSTTVITVAAVSAPVLASVSQSTTMPAISVLVTQQPTQQPLPEPLKIELPPIVKRDIDTQPKKPVLSSPEHKLDILESIAPKNNDLSETIQKLESVIQQCAEINQISEDSSDSTDSEQRLIIEDESLSSETQHEFNMSGEQAKKEEDFNDGKKNFSMSGKKEYMPDSGMSDMMGNTTMNLLSGNFQSAGFFGSMVQQQKLLDKHSSLLGETTSIKAQIDLIAAASATGGSIFTNNAGNSNNNPSIMSSIKVEMFELTKGQSQSQQQHQQHQQRLNVEQFPPKVEEKSADTNMLHNESLSLLLCEETIPGSPAPPSSTTGAKDTPEAKKDYDNIFASPSHISSCVDIKVIPMDIEEIKMKRENASPNSSPRESLSHDDSCEDVRKIEHGDVSPRKRRRSKKPSECETFVKRRKGASRRNTATGSDSEDNNFDNIPRTTISVPSSVTTAIISSTVASGSTAAIHHRPAKPCQYNFLVQLDPALNSNQRIAILNKKIQDLRKTYAMIKAELASIDRRRKKLRRREREKKNQQKLQANNV